MTAPLTLDYDLCWLIYDGQVYRLPSVAALDGMRGEFLGAVVLETKH